MGARLNPVISSAASVTNSESTYHTLTGQAEQIYLCAQVNTYFTFDATGDIVAVTSGCALLSSGQPIILNVNHPTYINALGTSTGFLYIVEFV